MRRYLFGVAFMALACSASEATGPETLVTTDGPLRLTVTDAVSSLGILFAKPSVTSEGSTIVVTNSRYGSLCLYDVLGKAEVSGTDVVVRITYSPRLTLCAAEIRMLSYRAEVSGLAPKTYTVRVVHSENNVSDTLVTQVVTLP